jgi:hypothetical protein
MGTLSDGNSHARQPTCITIIHAQKRKEEGEIETRRKRGGSNAAAEGKYQVEGSAALELVV